MMNWDEVRRLFSSAKDLAPQQRDKFLDNNPSDSRVKSEVRSLLEASLKNLPALFDSTNIEPSTEFHAEPLPEGRLSGRYELRRELGRGGMGIVYEAYDHVLPRTVAVKKLRADSFRAETIARFRREAKTIAQMDHPGIIKIFDYGSTPEPFFVMPLVESATLREEISKATLSTQDILEVGIQIAEALDYSHIRQIVHRDVKPENIFIHRDINVVHAMLMDFGIALPIGDSRLTATGQVFGTLPYLSPEHRRSDLDGRADLYALGVVLYECLCGETPFLGANPYLFDPRSQEQPKPLSDHFPNIDPDLEQAISCCLSNRREDRFSHGRDLARALRICRDQNPEAGAYHADQMDPPVQSPRADNTSQRTVTTAGIVALKMPTTSHVLLGLAIAAAYSLTLGEEFFLKFSTGIRSLRETAASSGLASAPLLVFGHYRIKLILTIISILSATYLAGRSAVYLLRQALSSTWLARTLNSRQDSTTAPSPILVALESLPFVFWFVFVSGIYWPSATEVPRGISSQWLCLSASLLCGLAQHFNNTSHRLTNPRQARLWIAFTLAIMYLATDIATVRDPNWIIWSFFILSLFFCMVLHSLSARYIARLRMTTLFMSLVVLGFWAAPVLSPGNTDSRKIRDHSGNHRAVNTYHDWNQPVALLPSLREPLKQKIHAIVEAREVLDRYGYSSEVSIANDFTLDGLTDFTLVIRGICPTKSDSGSLRYTDPLTYWFPESHQRPLKRQKKRSHERSIPHDYGMLLILYGEEDSQLASIRLSYDPKTSLGSSDSLTQEQRYSFRQNKFLVKIKSQFPISRAEIRLPSSVSEDYYGFFQVQVFSGSPDLGGIENFRYFGNTSPQIDPARFDGVREGIAVGNLLTRFLVPVGIDFAQNADTVAPGAGRTTSRTLKMSGYESRLITAEIMGAFIYADSGAWQDLLYRYDTGKFPIRMWSIRALEAGAPLSFIKRIIVWNKDYSLVLLDKNRERIPYSIERLIDRDLSGHSQQHRYLIHFRMPDDGKISFFINDGVHQDTLDNAGALLVSILEVETR